MSCGTIEDYAYGNSPIHHLDARVKLCGAFAVILSVVSLPRYDLAAAAIHLIFPVVLVALGDLPVWLVLKRLLQGLPFVAALGFWAPFVDTQPVMLTDQFFIARGWFLLVSLVLRFFVAVGILVALSGTTHLGRLTAALGWFRVPGPLVLLITLIYRYLFVLFNEGQQILLASQLRGGAKIPSVGHWGQLMASLFGRTVRRGERVHTAMCLRGFDVDLPQEPFGPFKWRDLTVLILQLGVLAAVQLWARDGWKLAL